MINFKKRNSQQPGFSLVEVVLTLVVIGIVVSALLALQGNLLRAVYSATGRLARAISMKNFLVESHIKQWADSNQTQQKTIDNPPVKLTYQTKKISESSSLKKLNDLVIEQITCSWQGRVTEGQETMISLLYKPEHTAS
jgi:prepilin-type N-terminal cleavage/methylation domain-containing protein